MNRTQTNGGHMKKSLLSLFTLAALFLSITPSMTNVRVTAASTLRRTTTPTALSNNGLKEELAQARRATARYHTVEEAEADGYVSINFCEPGEGCHWLKPSLVDAIFEVDHPEILLYAPDDNGRLRLVAVEYIAPIAFLPSGPPDGFSGNEDLWREDTEGAGLWESTVWLWLNNPNGMFEQHNPRVP